MKSPGDPTMEPKSQDFWKKGKLWGVPKGLWEGGRKNSDFGIPSKAENEAGAWAPARFSLFTGSPKKQQKWSQNGPKRLPNPTQNAPKSIQERSRKIHKK